MNTPAENGKAATRILGDWWVESDAKYDTQAYVLRPFVVLELATEIIADPSAYLRTRNAAQMTLARLRKAGEIGELTFSYTEKPVKNLCF